MTKKEIYWDVLFVAEGIATLMTKEEVISEFKVTPYTEDIPILLSGLFYIMRFHYEKELYPIDLFSTPGDWKVRAEFTKEELKRLYE